MQIWAFSEDREGRLWIGTSWGLLQRLPDGHIVHSSIHPVQGTDHAKLRDIQDALTREDQFGACSDTGTLDRNVRSQTGRGLTQRQAETVTAVVGLLQRDLECR